MYALRVCMPYGYVCPVGTNGVPQRKSVVLLAEVIYKKGLPKKSRSEFFGKRARKRFLGKAPVGL